MATTMTRLCGREVLGELPGGRSLLLRESDGSRLVAKPLPRDCLARTSPAPQLHGHVHDRLRRLRELPTTSVAALVGVEWDDAAGPHLLWQFVPGLDLGQPGQRPRDAPLELARDIVLAVERLHLLGIVHGALHPRNLIACESGKLLLTHASPLVIDDETRDVQAVLRILRDLNASAGGGGASPELSRILSEAVEAPDLALLRRRLLLAGTARYLPSATPAPRARRLPLLLGLILALGGILLSLALWGWISAGAR